MLRLTGEMLDAGTFWMN